MALEILLETKDGETVLNTFVDQNGNVIISTTKRVAIVRAASEGKVPDVAVPTPEAVERVARAIYEADRARWDWSDHWSNILAAHDCYRDRARAALAARREGA